MHMRIQSMYRAAFGVALFLAPGSNVSAQCSVTEVTSGLRFPLGITRSNTGNFMVAESGTAGVLNSGRISIVEPSGRRRNLIDGLPSAPNDVGDPSGPSGIFMSGRTLYVTIGQGDTVLPGPFPGALLENPTPSSAMFSSVVAVHFSAAAEAATKGFVLTAADRDALANGGTVRLVNGAADWATIEMLANFPDTIAAPLPGVDGNVRASNPFDLTALDGRLFVADGGRNLVWQVEPRSMFDILAEFAPVANPLFGIVGPPVTDAVPTGISVANGYLLVTLFGGFPFGPGASSVEWIDPKDGQHAALIENLTDAIDVLPILSHDRNTDFLILQFASAPILAGNGTLVRGGAGQPGSIVSACLDHPTSMAHGASGALYVTELPGGLVVLAP